MTRKTNDQSLWKRVVNSSEFRKEMGISIGCCTTERKPFLLWRWVGVKRRGLCGVFMYCVEETVLEHLCFDDCVDVSMCWWMCWCVDDDLWLLGPKRTNFPVRRKRVDFVVFRFGVKRVIWKDAVKPSLDDCVDVLICIGWSSVDGCVFDSIIDVLMLMCYEAVEAVLTCWCVDMIMPCWCVYDILLRCWCIDVLMIVVLRCCTVLMTLC
jgi:hypothetical protein